MPLANRAIIFAFRIVHILRYATRIIGKGFLPFTMCFLLAHNEWQIELLPDLQYGRQQHVLTIRIVYPNRVLPRRRSVGKVAMIVDSSPNWIVERCFDMYQRC